MPTGKLPALALLVALAIALLCVLLQAAGLQESLRYDRAAITAGAWWRLLTGNFVHLGWSHLAMNLAGLALVVALLWEQFKGVGWILLVLASSLATGIGLYALNSSVDWYVGFSGTLHGLILAGCLGDLRDHPRSGGLLLALVIAKIAWEQATGALPGSSAFAGGPVLVDAHLYGALGGALTGAALLLRRSRTRRAPRSSDG